MTAHVFLNSSNEWKKRDEVCRIVNHLYTKSSKIVIIMKEYIC